MHLNVSHDKGFTGLKLLILIALLSALTVLLLPSQDDTIRARVTQGLHQADLAKSALAAVCRSGNGKVVAKNSDAGFFFIESMYVAEIQLSADCSAGTMGIRIRTQNTGAEQDPEILLISGRTVPSAGADGLSAAADQPEWRCGLASGEADHVPEDCRVALNLG
jgi:type IV pilus assembly protein PilA